MPMVDGDWSVDRATGDIRYIGFDHSPTTTVTAGSFVTGDYYQIRSVGTTDFTLVGAANNNVGTRFEATGAGTGTGVATQAASYATVIQFHRWLQALADDPEFSGDDELDIISQDPSARSTDNIITLTNGFNVNAATIEHLYDGSITQGTGTTQERWDGIVNFGNASAHIQVIQGGAVISDDYWNYGWQAGSHTGASGQTTVLTDSTASWTTDQWIGYTIVNVTDGSRGIITSNTGTTITVAYLFGGTDNDWDAADVYNIAVPINGDTGAGISHRFMVKVRDFGNDIARRRLLGTTRRWGNTFSEFPINGTNPGNNVLALSDSNDLNNTTAFATVAGWNTITNTEGLRLIDISGDGTPEEYYSEWNRDTFSINQFYERMKYLTYDSTSQTINGQNGELHRGVTHSMPYDTETGGVVANTNDKFVFGTYVNHGAVTGGPFVVGESVHEDTATPVWYGRVLSVDGTDTSLIIDIESGTVGITESFTGQTSGAQATTTAAPAGGEIQLAAGELAIFALDDDGATGNIYGQLTKGIAPLDNTRL